MDIYATAINQIIRQQISVIGSLALDQAKNVQGLEVAGQNEIHIKGNGKQILENLVQEYSRLFGQASVEVCKDAVKEIHPPIPAEYLPQILV